MAIQKPRKHKNVSASKATKEQLVEACIEHLGTYSSTMVHGNIMLSEIECDIIAQPRLK